MIGQFFKLVST